MRILAIETCTEACSAALLDRDECVEKFELAPRRHAQLILPMVDSLLAESGLAIGQIDAIAFSRGPGAFTGVRIGTAAAQGIALGTDLPLLPVSTLACLALRGATRSQVDHVAVALDARMSQVYVGLFSHRSGGVTAICPEHLASPSEALMGPLSDWVALGSGWDKYPRELGAAVSGKVVEHLACEHPHAADVARLGAAFFETSGGIAVEEAVPVYLRDQVADKRARSNGRNRRGV